MDGQLEQRDGRWQLRFDRKLPHPPEKVWRAITEPEHLTAWFPFDIEGERAAGAPVLFVFRNGEAPPFEGEMTVYEPPRVLELRWGGNETVRLEVQPDGEGSVLTLLNTFDEPGKASRDAAGWHVCLDALGYHLDGADAPWTPRERWEHVHQTYVERLGPEASAIGPPAPAVESA
ncbi:MAG TPA: SRPBCC family protein [Chloroflexota bacterium]